MEIQILKNQSLFDIAIQETLIADNAFEIAYANSKSISEVLQAAAMLNIPSVFPVYTLTVAKPERPEATVTVYNKTLDRAASFFDLAREASGIVENAFDLAYVNNRSISDILAAATIVKIPAIFPLYISEERKTEASEAPETLHELIVSYKSCFFDFAIDSTGEAENAFEVAYNSFRSISDILQINDVIMVSSFLKSNRSVVNYYIKNNIKSASGINKILELYSIFDITFDNTFN